MKYRFFRQLSKRDTNAIKGINEIRGILYSQNNQFVFKETKSGDYLLSQRTIDNLNNGKSFISNIICFPRALYIEKRKLKDRVPEHLYKYMSLKIGSEYNIGNIYRVLHLPEYYLDYSIKIIGLNFKFKRRIYTVSNFFFRICHNIFFCKIVFIVLPGIIIQPKGFIMSN